MNDKVDIYLSKVKNWREELVALRTIILDCGLIEELKWGKPCYTVNNHNVAILQGFKEYCALMFFKGALLQDKNGILTKPGENTQAGRLIRFTNVQEIEAMRLVLKAYTNEATTVEQAGLKVKFKEVTEFPLPQELQSVLDKDPTLKTAFNALTPGRQKGYLLYFSAAKQSKTRQLRIEKCLPLILKGKGLHD